MFFEAGTSAYLWIIAFLVPIKRNIYSPNIVWNSTAVTIVGLQVLVIVSVMVGAVFFQNKKWDFI